MTHPDGPVCCFCNAAIPGSYLKELRAPSSFTIVRVAADHGARNISLRTCVRRINHEFSSRRSDTSPTAYGSIWFEDLNIQEPSSSPLVLPSPRRSGASAVFERPTFREALSGHRMGNWRRNGARRTQYGAACEQEQAISDDGMVAGRRQPG